MIESKTLDAVIAVSQAQHDVATNSKQFKDNLKLLVDKKAGLNKLSAEIKKRQTEVSTSLKEVAESQAELSIQESKIAASLKRLEKGKADLAAAKAIVSTDSSANAAMRESLDARLAELVKDRAAFDKSSSAKLASLNKREVAVEKREAFVNRVATAMEQ